MANYISAMPLWAIVLFVAGFLYSLSFIATPAKQAALNAGMTPDRSRNIQFGILGFYIIYLAYVSIFSIRGVFAVNAVPPRIFVFATLPLAVILFAIVGTSGLFKKVLRAISLESLIAIHVFRLLGSFFILLYFYHLLPTAMAFSSGMGDIITALFALPVAKMVAKGRPGSIRAAYAWNIFGTMDVVALLAIVVVTVIKSIGSAPNAGLLEMNLFPFVWFPAFAPATLLFLHATIFRKLRQMRAK